MGFKVVRLKIEPFRETKMMQGNVERREGRKEKERREGKKERKEGKEVQLKKS